MSNAELRPISVPLQERQLFVNDDFSGGLTREGSIFQRVVIFDNILSSEELHSGMRQAYENTMNQDKEALGISEHDNSNMRSQWLDILKQREERLRHKPAETSTAVTIFEAVSTSGA